VFRGLRLEWASGEGLRVYTVRLAKRPKPVNPAPLRCECASALVRQLFPLTSSADPMMPDHFHADRWRCKKAPREDYGHRAERGSVTTARRPPHIAAVRPRTALADQDRFCSAALFLEGLPRRHDLQDQATKLRRGGSDTRECVGGPLRTKKTSSCFYAGFVAFGRNVPLCESASIA